jgi:hypothetical protein
MSADSTLPAEWSEMDFVTVLAEAYPLYRACRNAYGPVSEQSVRSIRNKVGFHVALSQMSELGTDNRRGHLLYAIGQFAYLLEQIDMEAESGAPKGNLPAELTSDNAPAFASKRLVGGVKTGFRFKIIGEDQA